MNTNKAAPVHFSNPSKQEEELRSLEERIILKKNQYKKDKKQDVFLSCDASFFMKNENNHLAKPEVKPLSSLTTKPINNSTSTLLVDLEDKSFTKPFVEALTKTSTKPLSHSKTKSLNNKKIKSLAAFFTKPLVEPITQRVTHLKETKITNQDNLPVVKAKILPKGRNMAELSHVHNLVNINSTSKEVQLINPILSTQVTAVELNHVESHHIEFKESGLKQNISLQPNSVVNNNINQAILAKIGKKESDSRYRPENASADQQNLNPLAHGTSSLAVQGFALNSDKRVLVNHDYTKAARTTVKTPLNIVVAKSSERTPIIYSFQRLPMGSNVAINLAMKGKLTLTPSSEPVLKLLSHKKSLLSSNIKWSLESEDSFAENEMDEGFM